MPRESSLPGSPLFWQKVTPTGFCWEWGGHLTEKGYGRFSGVKAHRVAWELLVGPAPEGLEPDHLCRNRACVNPDHLEWVTHPENVSRSIDAISAARRLAGQQKTHCKHGHEYTPENTRLDRNGWRKCRTCHRLDARERRIA